MSNDNKLINHLENQPLYIYNYYVCDYCPLPSQYELNIKFKSKRRNPGFKTKVFNKINTHETIDCYNTSSLKSIRTIIEKLYDEGYTHIVNMRGSFHYICKIARIYKITVCDYRLRNYVANRYYNS